MKEKTLQEKWDDAGIAAMKRIAAVTRKALVQEATKAARRKAEKRRRLFGIF